MWTLLIERNNSNRWFGICKYEWFLRQGGMQVDSGYAFSKITAKIWGAHVMRARIKNEKKKSFSTYRWANEPGDRGWRKM